MITQELVQRVQKLVNVYNQTHEEQFTITYHKPTQPRMPPISIGGGIGEQRGENKRMLVTLN